jgi:Xaa-Pro aminopeptidase
MPKLDDVKTAALKNMLKENKLDGYVISDINDLKYFIGSVFMHPGEGLMLAHKNGFYISSRSLYEAPVRADFPQIQTEGFDGDRSSKIIEAAKKLGLKAVGFDGDKEFYVAGKAYEKAGFKNVPGLVGQLRIAKTETEIKIMKESAGILYAAFKYVQKFLKPGVSERQIARLLENYMLEKGAGGPSFPVMVSFGAGSANPHFQTGDAKLKKNMPVMIDFGCYYKNYCSDITRTFWYGDKPSPEFQKVCKIVKDAHDMAVKQAKYGMSGAEIDAIARGHIEAAGYGKYFTHRTGHGIGLQPHETADISQLNNNKIGLNYCFSIEPGIYLPGKFGVRWEDCFYMAKNGIEIIK